MFLSHIVVTALLLIFAAACDDRNPLTAAPTSLQDAIAWADEFDGPAGSRPDPRSWTYDLGNNRGWGNNELQSYTAETDNARLDGQGHLVLRVESTSAGYTSARIKTQGLRLVKFGRIEARIKLPRGQGIWPAFWMLGGSFNGSNWPQCGEIDIVEYKGSETGRVHSTVHGPSYSGGRGITATYNLPSGDFSDAFHVFAIAWTPGSIRFFVDDVMYHAVTAAELPSGASWVFDQPFFLLLNVAVGGNFVGRPDDTTQFPQEMIVDYVRYTPNY
jgi:beta-glucanase (GH16 family)